MPGRKRLLDVHPQIPEPIHRLGELAEDLWYSWHRPARALFAALDPDLWEQTGHNPKRFLRRVDERLLQRAATDEVYLARYRQVTAAWDAYLQQGAPARAAEGLAGDDLVAYFCAEFGLHESLHIYSGGLGILAGHHCKGASDLRLPMVAVGLLYRAGYFSQTIDSEGRQHAHYVEAEFDDLPVRPALDDRGAPIEVTVPVPEREARARVWEVRAGHVRVFLLDTDVEGNSPRDRRISRQLYGGDGDTRIQQELVLGVGGVRALRRLGIAPTVWHLNEGHPAFSILERVRELVEQGHEFDTALAAVAASTVFTTHTPVPAGHDHFSEPVATRYLAPLQALLGVPIERVIALGRTGGSSTDFNMTTLALKGSRFCNGVSRLHGAVAAELCRNVWPQVPPRENPMRHVTNGVHLSTVLAQDWIDLFDRFLGVDWSRRASEREYWRRLHDVPDQLFWSVKQSIKAKTLVALREALRVQHRRNRQSESHIGRLLRYLDPDDPNLLTVGFARRFATYKRSTLLFRDMDWLRRLVADEERTMVFVFAGKAHPADEPAQALIQRIHEIGCMPEFLGKVLLVEGYDLELARRLVAGVDVWLNTPIHRTEASGTSGMKAAVNGTLNLSVTDGWWAEGFEGDNGWAILPSPHEADADRRDGEDARTLYEILQDEVIPLYYDRGRYGYSPGWVAMAKRSMASVLPRFSMARVIAQYAQELYVPAAESGRRLTTQKCAGADALAQWRRRVEAAWPKVALQLAAAPQREASFGEHVSIEVQASLDDLTPNDVVVELLLEPYDDQHSLGGPAGDADGDLEGRVVLPLEEAGADANGREHRFRLEFTPSGCGRFSYRVRMYPHHPLLTHPFETGLMLWLE